MDVYNQVNEKVNAKCLIRFCFLYETKALYCSTLRLTEIKKTTVPRGGGGGAIWKIGVQFLEGAFKVFRDGNYKFYVTTLI